MERRIALKTLTLAAGSLLALPAWASNWTKASMQLGQPLLTSSQQALLGELAETLIPASDTPGAKDLGVPAFVERMVNDCYEEAVQDKLKAGLATVETLADTRYKKPFTACDTTQRQTILQQLALTSDPDQKAFFTLVKNLTIQGFTTSEYVMTQHLHYVMAPGHYYGCAPVKKTTK